MKMAKGESHAQTVELGPLLWKLPGLSQVHEQLTAAHELHYEENLQLRLEHELHANEERMIRFLQNVLLQHGRLNLVVIQNNVLS